MQAVPSILSGNDGVDGRKRGVTGGIGGEVALAEVREGKSDGLDVGQAGSTRGGGGDPGEFRAALRDRRQLPLHRESARRPWTSEYRPVVVAVHDAAKARRGTEGGRTTSLDFARRAPMGAETGCVKRREFDNYLRGDHT